MPEKDLPPVLESVDLTSINDMSNVRCPLPPSLTSMRVLVQCNVQGLFSTESLYHLCILFLCIVLKCKVFLIITNRTLADDKLSVRKLPRQLRDIGHKEIEYTEASLPKDLKFIMHLLTNWLVVEAKVKKTSSLQHN